MTTPDEAVDLTTVTIEHRGKRLTLDAVAGDHIASVIAGSGTFYEWQMLGALEEYLKPGDFVIDVGANIGNHSLYFAAVCGAEVLAFEPLPLTADILQRNVEQNFLDDQVEVSRKVIGAESSTATLIKFDHSNIGATSFGLSSSGGYTVSALDLERIHRKVALIKVDAEGMDIPALRGAVGLISRDRPIIVCEAATPEAQTDLEEFAAQVSYSFIAEFNATPTYILAPSATDIERAAIGRRSARLATQTNLAVRDLNYRLGLVNADLRRVRETQDVASPTESSSLVLDLEERLSRLEASVASLTTVFEKSGGCGPVDGRTAYGAATRGE